MRPYLGTYVEIGAHCALGNEVNAIDAAFMAIQEIHNLMSFHQIESDISRLNMAKGNWVEIDKKTKACLKFAKTISRFSDGLFNPTIGGELVEVGILPNHGFGNYSNISDANIIEINGNQVRLLAPALICLDGIAKGFAVDYAIKCLKSLGCEYGWVNAGGDIRVFGNHIFPISIRNEKGRDIEIGGIQNCAIATSVVRKKHNQNFPSWIIGKNKRQGSYSIMASSAWRADALTKIACNFNKNIASEKITQLGGHLIEV